MVFNQKKFETITYGKSDRPSQYTTPNGTLIERKDYIKDLGIIIQENLKFDRHIATIAAKGHRMVGWSLRSFKTRETKTMRILLQSLIISQCEYGSIVWSPRTRSHVNLLESVQKKFTSRFARFQSYEENAPRCNIDYPTRLRVLGLYSMERRRERYAIVYLYKITIQLVPNPGLQIHYDPRRKTTVEPKSVISATIPAWIRNARNNSFFSIGPKLYNGLPAHLRELESIRQPSKLHVDAFKRKLDRHLQSIPDIPGSIHNSLIPV